MNKSVKNRIRSVVAATMLALAFTPLATGCRTPHTAQQLAIKSMETTWQSVHSARVVIAKLYHDGRVTQETMAKAYVADKKFREAFDQALTALAQDWNGVTPMSVAVAAEAFINIVLEVSQ